MHLTNLSIKLKTGNQLKFQQCRGMLVHRTCTTVDRLCREMPDLKTTAPKMWLSDVPDFNVPITVSWQCYTGEWIESLCEMRISLGDVWLTVDQAVGQWLLIKPLIRGDLGRGHS